jgi:hypothetical protein
VESSCVLGNEPPGSIKCCEVPRGCKTCGLSSGTQLHSVITIPDIIHRRVFYLNKKLSEIGFCLCLQEGLIDRATL